MVLSFCKSEIHKDFRMKTLLTVTSAGAKLVNISSLIEHPGKLIHLSLRFPTLKVIKRSSKYIVLDTNLIEYMAICNQNLFRFVDMYRSIN